MVMDGRYPLQICSGPIEATGRCSAAAAAHIIRCKFAAAPLKPVGYEAIYNPANFLSAANLQRPH